MAKRRKVSLAHIGDTAVLFALLIGSGAMCERCGCGTRKTSKNWGRCKRCNYRVRIMPMGTLK